MQGLFSGSRTTWASGLAFARSLARVPPMLALAVGRLLLPAAAKKTEDRFGPLAPNAMLTRRLAP